MTLFKKHKAVALLIFFNGKEYFSLVFLEKW